MNRINWENRYAADTRNDGLEASEFLVYCSEFLPSKGLALDIAAGGGRNSNFLASRGLDTVAVDFSAKAIEKCLGPSRTHGVMAVIADLSNFVILPETYDVIVNFNFLDRRLARSIVQGLRPGGLLVFETMTTRHLRWKPAFNRDYLLAPGELLAMFSLLDILKYREADLVGRSVASMLARKPPSSQLRV